MIPSPACRRSRGRRGDGILNFKIMFGVPRLRGLGRLPPEGGTPNNPKRCRAALAAALQIFVVAITTLSLFACSNRANENASSQTATRTVTDEAGRRLLLPQRIDRIISLAPNLTEIVYAVGAGDRLVGDTEYCDYPAEARSVAKIGDTMNPSVERIIALKPQIVLVSTASQLEAFTKQLDQQRIAVYVTNPGSLDEIFHSITVLGGMLDHSEQATLVATDLRKRAEAVKARISGIKPVSVFYQVAGEPLYT